MSENYWKNWTRVATAVVCLSGSVAHANQLSSDDQSVLDNLTGSSGVVTDRISSGNTFSQGIGSIAADGLVVSSDAHMAAIIDDQMQDAYNNAMQAFMGHQFYGAQDHLDDLAAQAGVELDTAIDTYTDAAVALQSVVVVNQMASDVVNTDQAEVMQDYAASSGADQGITDELQGDYNNGLQGITSAAREFATYKSASVDAHLVEHMDSFADQYEVSMADAYTSLDLVSGYITTVYETPGGSYVSQLTHSTYFAQAYESQSIYE